MWPPPLPRRALRALLLVLLAAPSQPQTTTTIGGALVSCYATASAASFAQSNFLGHRLVSSLAASAAGAPSGLFYGLQAGGLWTCVFETSYSPPFDCWLQLQTVCGSNTCALAANGSNVAAGTGTQTQAAPFFAAANSTLFLNVSLHSSSGATIAMAVLFRLAAPNYSLPLLPNFAVMPPGFAPIANTTIAAAYSVHDVGPAALAALATLYSATSPWSSPAHALGWLQYSMSPSQAPFACQWNGVLCSFYNSGGGVFSQALGIVPYATSWPGSATTNASAFVTWLGLGGLGLSASSGLPDVFSAFPALVQLDVSSNSLLGSSAASLPPSLVLLQNLTTLSIAGTSLSLTNMPAMPALTTLYASSLASATSSAWDNTIGGLGASLVTLDVSSNALASFPLNFGSLTQLVTLSIQNGKFASLSAGLCGCASLQWLFAGSNQISSVDPCVPASLRRLNYLDMSFNRAPWSFGLTPSTATTTPGNLTALVTANLGTSNLVDMGAALVNSYLLTTLTVNLNRALASISAAWNTGTPRPFLTSLDFSYCGLSGSAAVPSGIFSSANFPALRTLVFDYNGQLTNIGAVTGIATLTSFSAKYCNLLSFPLLSGLSVLSSVDLSYNTALPLVPAFVADLPLLATMTLVNCSIASIAEGVGPPSATFTGRFYKSLSTLLVSNNSLAWLPAVFANSSAGIALIDASYNLLQAALFPPTFFSARIQTLKTNGNPLMGAVSPNMSSLVATSAWECSNCGLTVLDPALCAMPALATLLLPHNAVVALPSCMAHMSVLSLLDLSFNVLTVLPVGNSPSSNSSNASIALPLLPQLVTLRLTGNSLGLDTIDKLSLLPKLTTLYLDSNALFGMLPPSLASFPKLATISLANNRLLSLPPQLPSTVLTTQDDGITVSPASGIGPLTFALSNLTNSYAALPSFFQSLPASLSTFVLDGNQLSGDMTPQPLNIFARGSAWDCPLNATVAPCISAGRCGFGPSPYCTTALPTSVWPLAIATLLPTQLTILGTGLTPDSYSCEFFTAAAAAAGAGGVLTQLYQSGPGTFTCMTPTSGLLGSVTLRLRDTSAAYSTPTFYSSNGGYPLWTRPLPTLTFVAGCAPGTFFTGAACAPCSPGSNQSFFNQSVCELCAPGTYTPPTSSFTIGATSCYPCPVKTYASSYGASIACSPCNPGTFGNMTGLSECMKCPPGTAAAAQGSFACSACAIGSFSATEGLSTCQKCPSGSFTGSLGSTACFSCPPNTRVLATGAAVVTDCICDPGFYGPPGGNCTACPAGGLCDGLGALYPVCLPGYWVDVDVDPTLFYGCIPPEACLGATAEGNATCATGYTGRVCGTCEVLKYYRLGSTCNQCPSYAGLLWIGLVAAAFGAIFIVLLSSSPGDMKLYSPSIALTYVQMLALFHSFNVGWPSLVLNMFNSASVFNFNIQLFSPECSVALSYWTSWMSKIAIPVIGALIMVLYYLSMPLLQWLLRSYAAARNKLMRVACVQRSCLGRGGGSGACTRRVMQATSVSMDAALFASSWLAVIAATPFVLLFYFLRVASLAFLSHVLIAIVWDRCLIHSVLRWRTARARAALHLQLRVAAISMARFSGRALPVAQKCYGTRWGRSLDTWILFCCGRSLPFANNEVIGLPDAKAGPGASAVQLSGASKESGLLEMAEARRRLALVDATERRVVAASALALGAAPSRTMAEALASLVSGAASEVSRLSLQLRGRPASSGGAAPVVFRVSNPLLARPTKKRVAELFESKRHLAPGDLPSGAKALVREPSSPRLGVALHLVRAFSTFSEVNKEKEEGKKEEKAEGKKEEADDANDEDGEEEENAEMEEEGDVKPELVKETAEDGDGSEDDALGDNEEDTWSVDSDADTIAMSAKASPRANATGSEAREQQISLAVAGADSSTVTRVPAPTHFLPASGRVRTGKFKIAFLRRASFRSRDVTIRVSGLGGVGAPNTEMRLPGESGTTFEAPPGRRARTRALNARRRASGLTGAVIVTEPAAPHVPGFGLLPRHVLEQLKALRDLEAIVADAPLSTVRSRAAAPATVPKATPLPRSAALSAKASSRPLFRPQSMHVPSDHGVGHHSRGRSKLGSGAKSDDAVDPATAPSRRAGFINILCSDGTTIEIASWKLTLLPRTPVEVSLVRRFHIETSTTDRFMYGATNLMTLGFTFLAQTALEPLNCVRQQDGSYLLEASASVTCYDASYDSYMPLVVIAAVLYIVCVPLYLLYVLLYARARGLISTPAFDFRHGSLTLPFTSRMWYFELINTCRKLGIVIVVQFLGQGGTPDSTLSQLMVAMTLFSAFAMIQSIESPYAWAGNGTLALFTTLCLLFVIFAGILFFTSRLSEAAIYYVAATTVAVVVASAIAIGFTFLAEFRRAKQRSDVCKALGLNRYQLAAMEHRLLERMFPTAGEMLIRELSRLDEDEKDSFICDAFQLLRLIPGNGGLDPYSGLQAAQAASLGHDGGGGQSRDGSVGLKWNW